MKIVIYSIILFVLIIAVLVAAGYILILVKQFINNKKNLNKDTLNNIKNHNITVSNSIINSNNSVLSPYVMQVEEVINTVDDAIKSHLINLLSFMEKMNSFICSHIDKEYHINIMA